MGRHCGRAGAGELDGKRRWGPGGGSGPPLPRGGGGTAAPPGTPRPLPGPAGPGPDSARQGRQRQVWKTVGNPGAVLLGGRVIGFWTVRTRGDKLDAAVTLFEALEPAQRARLESWPRAMRPFGGAPCEPIPSHKNCPRRKPGVIYCTKKPLARRVVFFQLVKKPLLSRTRLSFGGGARGAAARLEWDRMPRMPCTARRSASAARTFPPLRGGKVTAFLQAVGKVLGLF